MMGLKKPVFKTHMISGFRCQDSTPGRLRLTPHMKLHLTNPEVGMWNAEGWSRFAKSFLKQTEYIHSMFDVGRSMFISFFLD